MSAACNIAFEELLDFVEDRAESAQRSRLEEHLQRGCRTCAHDVEWLRSITGYMRTDDSREPPAWVQRRAVDLFKQHGARPRPTLFERLSAILVFDNGMQPQLAGLRGAAVAPTRQMLFVAGALDIDIRTEPSEAQDQVTLLGQVLPRQSAGARLDGVEILLLQRRRELFSKMTDQLGEFTIGRLAHGKYRLLIRFPDKEIEIPDIEI